MYKQLYTAPEILENSENVVEKEQNNTRQMCAIKYSHYKRSENENRI